ncbi:hypothetical protein AMECASPLE_036107 [Ameca splendens]|uniref:Uncharacterized protein n=1 Tax=Ameca splendens TaxID=208324 RepID=A0ABV0XWS3_9TELE
MRRLSWQAASKPTPTSRLSSRDSRVEESPTFLDELGPRAHASFPVMQSPFSGRQASTPGTGIQQGCFSPAQVDPFYSQGDSLSSDDQLDQTWVTVFGYSYSTLLL